MKIILTILLMVSLSLSITSLPAEASWRDKAKAGLAKFKVKHKDKIDLVKAKGATVFAAGATALAAKYGLPDVGGAISAPVDSPSWQGQIPSGLTQLNYDNYSLLYNCQHRGYEVFWFNTVKDTGNLPRYEPFHAESRLPKRCRQYKESPYGKGYHRGHGVNSNPWDHSKHLMKQTNYFSNIVPQHAEQNAQNAQKVDGLWRHLEKVAECYRDKGEVFVVGGNVWGNNSNNDYFVRSHGVTTPDTLFKIMRIDNKTYAYLIPNDGRANYRNAANYQVSIGQIENALGYELPWFSETERRQATTKTLAKPRYCSLR
jgi:endonuclease G